ASYRGPVDAGSNVYVAEAGSSRWQLRAGGQSATRHAAVGGASFFRVERGGDASLRVVTPFTRYAAVLVEILVWALAIREVVRRRRRRHRVEVDISAASSAVEAQAVDAVAAGIEAADLGATR